MNNNEFVYEEVVAYDMINIEMKKVDGDVLKVGHPADVRELIEDMISEKLGYCPSLQEDVEEGEYQVYLHSESDEECSEEEIKQLKSLRITQDPETSTEGIKRLLQVEFRFVTESL